MNVSVKRAYEPFSAEDGYRILIDRLWPRGIKKEGANIDRWMKNVAPSTALRQWFDHDPEKWEEFKIKYHHELEGSDEFDDLVSCIRKNKTVTLLYAAKDAEHNHALVLQQLIKSLL